MAEMSRRYLRLLYLETLDLKLETVSGMLPRLLKQFAAVLLGALLYFFVLMPHLPLAAQHQPFRLDWGLLVLTWICLVIYGSIEFAARAMRKRTLKS